MTGADQKQIHALSQRVLMKAAERLGGIGELARHLGVGEATISEWIAGKSIPPTDVILKVVDPLIAGLPKADA